MINRFLSCGAAAVLYFLPLRGAVTSESVLCLLNLFGGVFWRLSTFFAHKPFFMKIGEAGAWPGSERDDNWGYHRFAGKETAEGLRSGSSFCPFIEASAFS